MPYDDPDATDPMTLHGVVVETQNDNAMREMAECFVEEYIRSGFDADRILRMFKTQGYAGPFLAYQTIGEEVIQSIIVEMFALWGGRNIVIESPSVTGVNISLPILDSEGANHAISL